MGPSEDGVHLSLCAVAATVGGGVTGEQSGATVLSQGSGGRGVEGIQRGSSPLVPAVGVGRIRSRATISQLEFRNSKFFWIKPTWSNGQNSLRYGLSILWRRCRRAK